MRTLLFLCMMLMVGTAQAALRVLACEPEWAALTQELAGERAVVSSATTARQDPHRIEARPALLAKARQADLLVCTGAELEVGWLPLLQREAGNAGIQPGQPGYFEAARYVRLLDKPASVDRSMGDVHAAGNPHLHLDPRNLLSVAQGLAQRLAELDPAGAAHYAERQRAFATRMEAAIARWTQQAAPLKGQAVLVHHNNWTYLAYWLGLKVVGTLEPKPGLDPSPAHLAKLLDTLGTQPAKAVLRTPYQSSKASDWIAERSGVRAIVLPYTVGGSETAQDLYALFDETIARLLEASR